MKKETKPRKRKNNRNQPLPLKLRSSFLLSWFWKLIVGVSVILGIIVSLLSFASNISVSTSQSLDPKDPLSMPFVITNNGPLPIHNVEILFGINKMTTPPPMNQTILNLNLGYAKPPIPVLKAHETMTFWCPPIFKFRYPINFADISVLVSYRPNFLFWRKTVPYRFVTVSNREGITNWYGKAESE
mgnify:CR=1 FL=1